MTIAIGFRCSDSLILCTDTQVSAEGHHKYYEDKIYPVEGDKWAVVFACAGLPSLMKEVHGKTYKELESGPISTHRVNRVIDTILTEMGRQYAEINLNLLAGVSIAGEPLEMLAFDGKGLHSGDYFNCFGVGDSSLIRYLQEASNYSPGISTDYGKALAIYLVSKAIKYIDGVGGEISLAVIRENGLWEPFLGDPEVCNKDAAMDGAERFYLPKIVETGLKEY